MDGQHLRVRDNHTIRGRITYVQPNAERSRPTTTKMEIVSHDWMEQGWYPVRLAIAGLTCYGRYFPSSYKLGADSYTYSGIFESEQAAAVPEHI